jgi:formylmethanofuran dehydrogenase subunit E
MEQLRPLHARVCPRQILGVRIGIHAGQLLGLDLPQADKRLLAFVETDGCFADGVAVATGCWLGRRTLRLVDHGKVAATFIDTASSRAIRLHPRRGARTAALAYARGASDRWHAQLDGYADMPVGQLLIAEPVALLAPVEDIVSRPGLRVRCDACGEDVMNAREVLVGQRLLCRACAGERYIRPTAYESRAIGLHARRRQGSGITVDAHANGVSLPA